MSAVRPRSPLTAAPGLAAILALAAVLALGPTPARAASPGEAILTTWAEALRAAGGEVRWAGLVDAGDERLDLADVEILLPGAEPDRGRISIPRISLAGLAAHPLGGFAVRSLTLPRLALATRSPGGAVTTTLTDVALADAVIPRPARAAFDPERPLASALGHDPLRDDLACARATVAAVAIATTGNGKTGRGEITLRDVALAGLSGSRVERATLAALAITAPPSNGKGAGRFTADGLEVEGWNPGAWATAFDDRAYVDGRGDGVWRPFLAAARTGRLRLEAEEGAISIERSTWATRSVRQFPEPLGAMVERMLREPDRIAAADLLRLGLEIFLATRHDGWSLEGLALTGNGVDRARIDRLASGPFAPEGLAELTVEGVDFAAPKALFRLGRFVLGDLRLPAAEDLRRAVPAALAGAEIDPSSLAPTVGRIGLEGLEVAEQDVPALRLGALRLDLERYLRAVPTAATLAVDHLVVPAGLADATTRATLAGLGYDRLDLSLAARLDWREARRELVLDGARLTVADLGEATAQARLAGVPRSLFLRPDTLPQALATITLTEATVTLTDASFVDRLVRLLARDARIKPERLRRRLADQAADATSALRDPARRKAFAAAVRGFVLRPTPITLSARPSSPIALPELLSAADDPVAAAEKLELSVTTGR